MVQELKGGHKTMIGTDSVPSNKGSRKIERKVHSIVGWFDEIVNNFCIRFCRSQEALKGACIVLTIRGWQWIHDHHTILCRPQMPSKCRFKTDSCKVVGQGQNQMNSHDSKTVIDETLEDNRRTASGYFFAKNLHDDSQYGKKDLSR